MYSVGGVTYSFGQFAIAVIRRPWLCLSIIFFYVAPASVAGYSATHGLALMATHSPTWQTIFAVIGAFAVSSTAFARIN